jgi:hypothetical protein
LKNAAKEKKQMINDEIDVGQKRIDEERAARGAEFEEKRLKRVADEAAALKLRQDENFKRRIKTEFLQANETATEADFNRLFPQIRDEFMLENFRRARESMTNQTGLEEMKIM